MANITEAHVSKELIDLLEKLIPEKCPSLNDSERDIFFYAGQRHLVVLLRSAYNLQNEAKARSRESRRTPDFLAGM